jgi:hypothetical protein
MNTQVWHGFNEMNQKYIRSSHGKSESFTATALLPKGNGIWDSLLIYGKHQHSDGSFCDDCLGIYKHDESSTSHRKQLSIRHKDKIGTQQSPLKRFWSSKGTKSKDLRFWSIKIRGQNQMLVSWQVPKFH